MDIEELKVRERQAWDDYHAAYEEAIRLRNVARGIQYDRIDAQKEIANELAKVKEK